MSVLATDDFNRANGGLGANWTTTAGDSALRIVSNQAADAGSPANAGARYTAITWPNDQYAQVVCKTVDTVSDSGMGPVVRATSGGDMYLVQTNTTETRLYKRVSGGYTQLGSDGAVCAADDVLYVSAVGTTITVKKNGSTIIGPVTDSGISAGSAGLWASTGSESATGDDWEGGDFAAGSSVGSASGAGSASGVGLSQVLAVGSAAGTGTASGVSVSSASVGSAAGTGSASGIGASQSRSLGSAAGTGAASGAGKSLATSVGTSSPTAGQSYSTTFSLTENPISESGIWVCGLATGLDWNNPETTSGHAIASVLSGAGGNRYDDSIAHLDASAYPFAADQSAQGTVYRVGGYDPGASNHEIELHLRFQTTAHNARGYEVLFAHPGNMAIVRWNGPYGDYTDLGYTGSGLSGPLVDGDVMKAEIIGSTINVYQNGNLVATQTDTTYTDGQPGMGFWPVDSATPGSYGWKDWQADSAAVGGGIATGIGKSSVDAVGSASGTGTASAIAKSTVAAIGSASGAGAASGIAQSSVLAVGAAAGTGAASGVSGGTAIADGAAAGTGSASGIGSSIVEAIGAIAGIAACLAVGASLAIAIGSATGVGSAAGVSGAVSTGTATGAGAASGIGASLAASLAAASGSGAASGAGESLVLAIGTASGAAVVIGIYTTGAAPMLIEEAIYALLSADAAVMAIAGGRIYPLAAPETQMLPSVIYEQVGSEEIETLGGDAISIVKSAFDIGASARGQGNYGTTKRLGLAIHDCLTGFNGGYVVDPGDITRSFYIQKIFQYNGGDNDDWEPFTKTCQFWRRFIVCQ